MGVNLDRSRLLQVVVYAIVVDTAYEAVMDADDVLHSGQPTSHALSACHSLSYTACTAFRQGVDKLLPDDLKLRADDLKLQTGDSKLQICNSRLRIVDLTLAAAVSGHHLDATKLRMGDSSVKLARASSVSPIPSFKLAIRSFKSAIRSVPLWHAGVTPAYGSVISSTQRPQTKHPNPRTEGKIMARFPTRENDVAVLAEGLIEGFTENTEYFPSPPVSPEELQTSYQAYKQARDAALTAAGAAKEAYDLKDEALDGLTDNMKANLKYAEIVADDNEAKLALLKWGGRRSAKALEPPDRPRDLEVARSGKGWVFLDWKPPLLGGDVAAYKVQVARPEEGAWKDVGMSVETELMVNDQERGVDLQFHVIAVNRAGQGGPSNIVRVVL